LILAAFVPVHAQQAFQDLDFELANPVAGQGDPGGTATSASSLPGWNVSMGATPQTFVYQNTLTLGLGSVDLLGPGYAAAGTQGPGNAGVMDGRYTLFLQAGSPLGRGAATIDQVGTIPLGDVTIEWKQWDWSPAATLMSVTFGGNALTPVVMGSGANYTLYGADVTGYSGQTADLQFSAQWDNGTPSWVGLDDISFSPTAVVPEPNIAVLGMMGGVVFALRRRFVR